MPRSVSSPASPDLFSYVPSPPVPGARTLAKAKPPVAELSSLSDTRLARLLCELTGDCSGGKLQARGRRASLSSTRPFRTPPVRWRALSHRRQGAQDARREHMLPRLSRSRSARPSGRLFRPAWRPVRSRSTSACRLPPCARCSRTPSRAGAGRPINLGQTHETQTTSKTRQMTCPDR